MSAFQAFDVNFTLINAAGIVYGLKMITEVSWFWRVFFLFEKTLKKTMPFGFEGLKACHFSARAAGLCEKIGKVSKACMAATHFTLGCLSRCRISAFQAFDVNFTLTHVVGMAYGSNN